MRVLLAEEDAQVGKEIKYMLEQNELTVELVSAAEMIYDCVMYDEYDVLVLNRQMAGATGIEICQELRKKAYTRGILIIGKNTVEERIAGYDAGVDDYLLQPFDYRELAAKVKALGRRSSQRIQENTITIGEFTLNRTAKLLKRRNRKIQLSPREFQIFDLLVQNNGIALSREIITDRIWGLETEVTSNNIDAYIKLLRHKLGNGKGRTIIKTVRGVGYKIEI